MIISARSMRSINIATVSRWSARIAARSATRRASAAVRASWCAFRISATISAGTVSTTLAGLGGVCLVGSCGPVDSWSGLGSVLDRTMWMDRSTEPDMHTSNRPSLPFLERMVRRLILDRKAFPDTESRSAASNTGSHSSSESVLVRSMCFGLGLLWTGPH